MPREGSVLLLSCLICPLTAWTDTYCAPGIEPGPHAQHRPPEYDCADPTVPRGSQTSPGPRASSWELGSLAPAELCSAPTVGYGPPEFQQASEGERGHVGLPPALRLFLHVLLKLDPASRLPPVGLLAAIQHQLVQLHKHLGWGAQGEGLGGPPGGPGCPGDVGDGPGRQGGREKVGREASRTERPIPTGSGTSWGRRSSCCCFFFLRRTGARPLALPLPLCVRDGFLTRCRRTPGLSSSL